MTRLYHAQSANMIPRLLKATLVVALLMAALLALRVQYQLGRFVVLGPSTPSLVRAIRDEAGMPLVGAEDFVIDYAMRRVYFSVFDIHAARAGKNPDGHLYMLSLDDPALIAHDITPAEPRPLRPHGIDLFRDAGGRVSLYVVNNPAIEVFDIAADGSVSHRETITSSVFIALNAVAVVAPRRFYVTNDEGARSALRRKLHTMLHTRDSSVVYFDGVAATTVVKGLNHSSGLVASRNGDELYAGEGFSWRMRVYRRDPAEGKLSLTRTIPLHTAPDNLKLDPDNKIWVGSHPQPYKVYALAADPSRQSSPARVVCVDLAKPNSEAVQIVFQDDGTRISSSAAGARVGNLLVVSSNFGSPAVVVLP